MSKIEKPPGAGRLTLAEQISQCRTVAEGRGWIVVGAYVDGDAGLDVTSQDEEPSR